MQISSKINLNRKLASRKDPRGGFSSNSSTKWQGNSTTFDLYAKVCFLFASPLCISRVPDPNVSIMESTAVFNPDSIELNAFSGDKPGLLKRLIRGLRNVVPDGLIDRFLAGRRHREFYDLLHKGRSEDIRYWLKVHRKLFQHEPRKSNFNLWHQMLHQCGAKRILAFGKAVEQELGTVPDRTQRTASGRSPIQVFAARGWKIHDDNFDWKVRHIFANTAEVFHAYSKTAPLSLRHLIDLKCVTPQNLSSLKSDWDVQYVAVLKKILPFIVSESVGGSRAPGTANFQDLDGNTALHFCFHSNTFDKNLYNLLMTDWGADDTIPNNFGVIPRQLRNPDIQTPRVRVFRHYGASKTTAELEECLEDYIRTVKEQVEEGAPRGGSSTSRSAASIAKRRYPNSI